VKLPRQEIATISKSKIVDYLLSTIHPTGKGKAAFFKHHGFDPEQWEALADALRHHVTENSVVQVVRTPYGEKYAIEGPLKTPGGESPGVRSIWFLEMGEEALRFVTAYPVGRRKE
jgi:hypothetical protein